MALPVADRSSNKYEQIDHAAEVIGRSLQRSKVFRAIYGGKQKIKTVKELSKSTGLTEKQVLMAGKKLADNDLVSQIRVMGGTAYEKVAFLQLYRDRILRLATNKEAREALPSKRRQQAKHGNSIRIQIDVKVPRRKQQAKHITVDDITSFAKVKKIGGGLDPIKMPENQFKLGIARILKEKGAFKDWGGELRDLSSSRLMLEGQRRRVAFAFKGPGMSGRLTPGKLGKNGDQIQRLSRCPADVFIVQYWNEIDDSVLEQLERFMQLKAYFENRNVWFGIIDGNDSARLINAYKSHFKMK